jgi:hypothetical protein
VIKVIFTKAQMLAILEGEDESAEVLRNEIVDTLRASVVYELIFKRDGKLYMTSYSIGTRGSRNEDEEPWENLSSVDCFEAEVYERTITDYRPVP